MDLFENAVAQDLNHRPLADAIRPRSLADYIGQEKAVGENTPLRRAIDKDRIPSVILWGPPGTGKTTLARLIANSTSRYFQPFSAVMGGVKELRVLVDAARSRLSMNRRQTILFIDEIHRFNRAQQDALLPHVEDGTITLIGATTENPSFQVNNAILSRCRVVILEALSEVDLVRVLERAANHPECRRRWPSSKFGHGAFQRIAELAHGDARRALNMLEAVLQESSDVSVDCVDDVIGQQSMRYDRSGDGHFQFTSALIKSMRASDPDAAAYWLERMMRCGEEPSFLLRRMIIFASEDIGHADPNALNVAVNAARAFQWVGLPEGYYALMQACTYLATAPKSDTVARTIKAAREIVDGSGELPVPRHLINAPVGNRPPTGPETHDDVLPNRGLPKEIADAAIFSPGEQGLEVQFRERLEAIRRRST